MQKKKNTRIYLFLFMSLFFFTLFTGCSVKSMENKAKGHSYEAKVLIPVAEGKEKIGDDTVVTDISNKNKGYLIAGYLGELDQALLQITGPDFVDYRYFFTKKDKEVVLPFTVGSGEYTIVAYENVGDTEYSFLWSKTLEINLEDECFPFLYPSQYVDFNQESKVVKKAEELDKDKATDFETIETIYNYVINHVEYDYDKADTVESGYLPDVDETLKTGKGICFDYSALMCAMLRSRGIPSKLIIGYTGDIYHAWINVYTKEKGWIDKVIQFNGDKWNLMDPTFASSDKSEENIKYITTEENYTQKYVR